MKNIFTTFLMLTPYLLFSQYFSWSPQTSGTTEFLRDVIFVDAQTGWAVGNNGTIIHTSDAGQTWSPQTAMDNFEYRSVFFLDANNGWIVGSHSSPLILKTTDGGANWQSVTPTGLNSGINHHIAFYDANIGWLLAQDSIYRTTDGGTTWIAEKYVANTDSPQARNGISITSDSTAFIAGSIRINSVNRGGQVFHRRPDNAPFLWATGQFSPSTTGDDMYAVEMINNDHGFAGGANGIVYFKSDFSGGGPWDQSFQMDSAQVVRDISFGSEMSGMVLTSFEMGGMTYAAVYHTWDMGTNWTSSPDTVGVLLQSTLHSPDSANAWIVGSSGGIYHGMLISPPGSVGNSLSNSTLSVYPNPAKDVIYLKNESRLSGTVNIISGSGQILNSTRLSGSDQQEISIQDLERGLYLIQLITDNSIQVLRFIKE